MTGAPSENSRKLEPNRAQRIGGGLLWSQIARVLDVALSFVIALVIVRALGPEEYAVYTVAWVVIGIGLVISSLGYGEALTRYVPAYQQTSPERALALTRRLGLERVTLATLVGLMIWVLSASLSDWLHTSAIVHLGGWLAALIIAQATLEPLVAYLTAILRLEDYAKVRFLAQGLYLVCLLGLFLVRGVHVWIPLCVSLLTLLLSIALYLSRMPRLLTVAAAQIDLQAPRRFGFYVWLTNLATFGLASQIDVLLIAALLTDHTQLSFYNLAVLLLARLYAVMTGWTAVLIPVAAEAYARNGKLGLEHTFDAYMKLNLAILLPTLVLVAVFANPIVVLLFGENFAPTSTLLFALTLFNLGSTLVGANICHPLLYVADQQRTLFGLRLGAGFLNIVLDLVLIPIWGALGAVVATGTSNLLTHLIELVLLRRQVTRHYPISTAFKLLVACALAIIPAIVLGKASWLALMLGSTLFTVIFVGVIRYARLLSSNDYALLTQALPRMQPILDWFVAK